MLAHEWLELLNPKGLDLQVKQLDLLLAQISGLQQAQSPQFCFSLDEVLLLDGLLQLLVKLLII